MKINRFLNGIPFEEISEQEWREFARSAQEKMLKIARYTPITNEAANENNKEQRTILGEVNMPEFEVIEKGGIECYTPLEVMDILKISKSKSYQLFRSKNFPSFRLGRNLRVTCKDFNNWLQEQKKTKVQL